MKMVRHVFNYYPTPLPDEHLASVVYRAFLLTYYKEIEHHIKVRHKQSFFDTPINCWVPAYESLFCHFSGLESVDTLLKRHSNVMDYGMWAAKANNTKTLADSLESLSTMNWKLSLYVATDRGWRYCPECANEEVKQHGTSYWHASHQRYYQRTCPKHNTLLIYYTSAKFSLPPIGESSIPASTQEIEVDRLLAKIVCTLRQLPHREQKKRLICALKQKLNVAKNMTRHSHNGRRLSQLHTKFSEAINTPEILPFFTFDKAISMLPPLTSMTGIYHMLNKNNQMHPMWYLMLIYAFLDEEDMLIAFDSTTDWDDFRWEVEANMMPISA